MTKIFYEELDYKIRAEICKELDVGEQWRELVKEIPIGAEDLQIDMSKINLMSVREKRVDGYSEAVLMQLTERNLTIKQLYLLLYKIDNRKAMYLLRPYVEDELRDL